MALNDAGVHFLYRFLIQFFSFKYFWLLLFFELLLLLPLLSVLFAALLGLEFNFEVLTDLKTTGKLARL